MRIEMVAISGGGFADRQPIKRLKLQEKLGCKAQLTAKCRIRISCLPQALQDEDVRPRHLHDISISLPFMNHDR